MKHFYLVLLIVSLLPLWGCTTSTSAPISTVEATPVSVPEYMTEVNRALGFIEETLAIAGEASRSLADGEITRQAYKEMAVAGKRNLGTVEDTMNSMIPPPESSGPASFEDVHKYLLLGIEAYKGAFDEMIKYGDDGRLSHIQEATNRIENFGDPYINTVEAELRILRKKFS